MNTKRVVYTAIFGDYDLLRPVLFSSDCDFICFSDREWSVPGWQVIRCDIDESALGLMNRKIKILAHKYLSRYEESLYIDGNIVMRRAPDEVMDRCAQNGASIAMPPHPYRNCVYEEGRKLQTSRKLSSKDKLVLSAQLQRYHDLGMPKHFGLSENNVIYRRHNREGVMLLCNHWWRELRAGCARDQIAMPFAIWHTGATIQYLADGPRTSRRYFDYDLHARDISSNPALNWIRLTRCRAGQSMLNWLFAALIAAVDRARARYHQREKSSD